MEIFDNDYNKVNFVDKNDAKAQYQVIHTYAPQDKWYALVALADYNGSRVMYWGSWGRNIDQFPRDFSDNPPFLWQGLFLVEK